MPAYESLSRNQHPIKDVHPYTGKTSFLAHSALTNKSYAFNFTNRGFEDEKNVPNAGASEVRGQIYGGSIGRSE